MQEIEPGPTATAATPPPEGGGLLGAVKEALSGREYDYTSGSLHRAILLLAIPMVLEMAMESIFAVCDVWFVSRLGAEAVATVGLTEAVLTLLYAIAFGLAMSTTAMVARRVGEKDVPAAVTAGKQAIALGIVISILVGVPGVLYGTEILELMGASEKTIAIGSGYTSTLLGTNVVIMLLFLNNSIFRGAGDAVIATRSLLIANGINLVLDPCLIFGWGPFPALGVTGAAVATTIGRGTGVLYQFWALRRGVGRIRLAGTGFRIDPGAMVRLLRISAGGIAQMLVATASWVVLMRIMAPFGDKAVAGYTIAIRVIIFALLPSWGLANAAATLVGQNLGAKQPERAERSVWLTGFYNTLFLGTVTLLFALCAGPLIGIFEDDPEILATGTKALRVISYGYVFYAWGMVMMQAFNGAGDTLTPTWANIIAFWMCQIPLAWFLAGHTELGVEGVFWAVMLSETFLALLMIVLFRRGRWKTQTV